MLGWWCSVEFLYQIGGLSITEEHVPSCQKRNPKLEREARCALYRFELLCLLSCLRKPIVIASASFHMLSQKASLLHLYHDINCCLRLHHGSRASYPLCSHGYWVCMAFKDDCWIKLCTRILSGELKNNNDCCIHNFECTYYCRITILLFDAWWLVHSLSCWTNLIIHQLLLCDPFYARKFAHLQP